jgi:hypothetical protein
MSYIFLQEQGEEFSVECFSDIPAYVLSKSKSIQGKSCCKDSETESCQDSRFGTMFARSTGNPGAEKSMLSQVDFLVRTFQQPEKEPGSVEAEADCGGRWRELSAKYDPDTCGWKTARCLWEEDLDWSCLTLPKWGSLHDGELWERTTPEHLTNGTGYGFWPTPKASYDGTSEKTLQMVRDGTAEASLVRVVKMPEMWPTPTKQDFKCRGPNSKQQGLPDVIKRGGTYPTPGTTGMSNGTGNCEKANKLYESGAINEEERRSMRAGNGGQLNPDWTEWLMGWPICWTSLEPMQEIVWLDWSVDPADDDSVESWPTPTVSDRNYANLNSGHDIGRNYLRAEVILRGENTGTIPRVAKNIPNRVARLKAIGNGQVPAVAALAWRILGQGIVDK